MNRILLIFSTLLFSGTASAQLFINEVCPGNSDVIYDPDFYNYVGYVELYNAGSGAINLSGYYLTDNSNKSEWTIPTGTTIGAKGYLLIWCDKLNNKLHTSFSLSSDGETLILSTPGLAQVDMIKYPVLFSNVSYGRQIDGDATWSYLISPSPKGKNVATTASSQLEKPVLSLKSGRYGGAQSVSLTHSEPTAEIHYTIDGSEPTIGSTNYSAPISISTTSTLKVKAFSANFLPSNTEVNTYFINEHKFTIPVVSISTKPAYLWDNTIGIYADGTNGITGNCQSIPKNWNRDWDRHADFEYFDVSGNKTFDQDIDLRIGGACSRGNAQKSFALQARNKYGKNTFSERFFSSKDLNEYSNLFLRNSGNDFNVTSFRDAFMQVLAVTQMDVDYMAYQPSALYLNGQYWGIQSLREKIDGDYIESNFGIKKTDVDLLETYENAIEGTNEVYVSYKNALQQMAPSDPATFKFIDDHIDVQEYINYLVSEIYYGNTDWPGNNIKFWRQRSTNGKFRWIFWDTDFGFSLYSSGYDHPTLNFATKTDGVDWPNPSWSTLHIRLVLQNPEFRTRFIQTLTTAMSTTFKPDRVIRFINDFKNPLNTEMIYHKQRWGGSTNDWEGEVQKLRDFATLRNEFMQQHTADFFGLSERVNLSVSTSPANTGTFKLNGIHADEPLVNGSYFKNLPYAIEAKPNAGFAFKNWKIIKRESTPASFIVRGDTWKYFDAGTIPALDWNTASFSDNSWASGPAQLGYGGDGEVTTVSYGNDASNKFITTYFRKTFNVADLTNLQNPSASVMFDDGVVVYLNGTEVFRNNMPEGPIGFSTLSAAGIPVEKVFYGFTIDKNLINLGSNTIAVEVHQSSGTSSDISFDFDLKSSYIGAEVSSTSNSITINDLANSDVVMEAVFEPLPSVSGIIINEFSAADSNVKDDAGESSDWIELYNIGANSVDVAGLYITDNISNKTKFKIPSGSAKTVMAPGAYLVLWADDEISQGVTHVNFKLSADGEELGLYQVVAMDTLALDEFTFGLQHDNASSSRIPNATGSFIETSKLTPASINIFEEVEVVTGNEREISSVKVYPNPAGNNIAIHSAVKIDAVLIYDLMGRTVKSYQGVEPETLLSMENLQRGLYLVKVRTGKEELVVKIIKQEE